MIKLDPLTITKFKHNPRDKRLKVVKAKGYVKQLGKNGILYSHKDKRSEELIMQIRRDYGKGRAI